jgi:hypothetical protein
MALYSISGVGYDCCDDFEPSAMISGKKERKQRQDKRKAMRTGINCKGSRIKAVALAVPRNAFLSLVRLNVKKFAVKLKKALDGGAREEKLMAKWCKLGGDASKLRSAINKAYEKYKRKHPNKVSGIGFAVESAIATATPIIVALMEFLKKAPGDQSEPGETELPTVETRESGETVEGIGAINPYLLAGAVGVGVYFLTKKRYI